jgi:hypothetical protein
MKEFVDMTGAEDMLQSMVTKASGVPVKPVAPAGDPNVASVIDTATSSAADYTTHRIPEGAETLGEAVTDLPNDLGGWLTDWLDGFDLTGPLAGIVTAIGGGAFLQWIMIAFVGMRVIDLGHNMITKHCVPVDLVNYRVINAAYEPVTAFLQSRKIETRDPVRDGEHTLIRIPVYHTRKAREAFDYLHKKTGLEYTTF